MHSSQWLTPEGLSLALVFLIVVSLHVRAMR
jgi:hypothetical protein